MRRRQYLAASAALLAAPLAGCAHPSAVLDMTEATDEDVADSASGNVDHHPEAGGLVAEAVENGSATVSDRSPPIDPGTPVEYEGRYYDLSVTETGERETTVYDVRIDYDGDSESGSDSESGDETPGSAVDYGDLPAPDRDTVDTLLPPPDDFPGGDGYDFGVGREYADEEAKASVLVPEQEYAAVVYEGTRYPVDAGGGRAVTVTDYRYETEEIAASAAEFGAAVRREYLFTLSGLSGAEREVVAEAIEDGYYEGSASDAFKSLVRRFREHEAVEADEWGGDWLVRYDGTVYLADLEHPPSLLEE
jgi:hypothetical protein